MFYYQQNSIKVKSMHVIEALKAMGLTIDDGDTTSLLTTSLGHAAYTGGMC